MTAKLPLTPDEEEAEACGRASFASPPCFMHELDPAWLGLNTGKQETKSPLPPHGTDMVKGPNTPSCKAGPER